MVYLWAAILILGIVGILHMVFIGMSLMTVGIVVIVVIGMLIGVLIEDLLYERRYNKVMSFVLKYCEQHDWDFENLNHEQSKTIRAQPEIDTIAREGLFKR